MRRKVLLLLSIATITFSFVGCNTMDGMKGDVAPKYFQVEANKNINTEGFETEFSKIYDVNNDGILEELDLVKKEGKAYILIKHAETGEMQSAIKIDTDSTKIEKISDEDNDGIEEITVLKNNNKEDVYRYNAEIKGYEL